MTMFLEDQYARIRGEEPDFQQNCMELGNRRFSCCIARSSPVANELFGYTEMDLAGPLGLPGLIGIP